MAIKLKSGTPNCTLPFERSTKIATPATTPPVGANDVHSFLHATAFRHHVFDHEDFFSGRNLEAAAQDEFAIFLFGKNESHAKLPGDFLSDDETAHGRSNHGGRSQRADFAGEFRAELLDDRHLLQGQRALEELAAVQTTTQDEMSFEQRAAIAENLQHLILRHARDGKREVSSSKFQVRQA